MRRLFKKIMDIWYLLCCAAVLGGRSFVIILSTQFKVRGKHRDFINRITHRGAVKILNIVKANYYVRYQQALTFDKNSIHIFMSNHQSLFDIPLIYAAMTQTIRPVTKAELFRIPLFGRAMYAGECIPIYRGDSKKRDDFMKYAKEKLASGVALWMFPEGTRSLTGQLLPLKSGGFFLAKEVSAKIIPVGIINTRAILPSKKTTIGLNQNIGIHVGEPIDASLDSIDQLKNKVSQAIEKLLLN